jgi:hypothetical protein
MTCQQNDGKVTASLTSCVVRALLIAAVCHIGSSTVRAQTGFGRPNNRPTFSPYLNLFRNQNRGSGGGNTLLNYYGMVRPQNQAFEQSQQISQGLSNLRRYAQQPGRNQRRGIPLYSQLGITGHPTAFMTIHPGAGGSVGGGFDNIGRAGFGGGSFAGGSFDGSGNSFERIGGAGGNLGGIGLRSMTGHPEAFSAGTRFSGAGIGN